MKKQTHTPAPWRRSGKTGINSKNRTICVMSIGDEECNANARLIAASPDLLGSLKDLMELMESTIESCGGHKSFFECDHSVNICSCHDRKIYEDAKELLEKFK